MLLFNGKPIASRLNENRIRTTKQYEAIKSFHQLARTAQLIDQSNPDAKAAKAAASYKHEKICKLLERYDRLSIEELAAANSYMNGASIRSISKTMKVSRLRLEKMLEKADLVLGELMRAFEND